jgi:mono/diheme cytochrome c family protein
MAADAPLAPQARQESDPTGIATVAAGANIAALGACMVCHTAQGGKPFAGGRPIDTPFGAIFSTNITPDAGTGIGQWSLEAFTRAMRKGVARDGHLLYPAFPYVHFSRMTDRDIGAVYAYLMSRDPVHAVAPANELVFPLNFRPLVAGWNLLFLPGPEAPADDGSHSAAWNRGRYLVDGVGHCAACHSPLNALGAEQRGKALSGGIIDGWEAPALTALSQAPTPWTQAQLVQYLRTGLADRHGAAAGPMLPVTRELADASAADVGAMATYLMSLQAPAPAGRAVPLQRAGAAAGAAAGPGSVLFAGACASCHGSGAPMSSLGDRPALSQSTAVNAASPRNMVRLILDGIPWEGSRSAHYMPAFSGMLSDAEIAAVANYTRNNYAKQAPWPALDADAVAKIRKERARP